MAEPATTINAVSTDTLLGGRIKINQPIRGYRVAIDPILLAAAVPARPGQSVLDAGTGTGAAAVCLLTRVPLTHVTGVEKQPFFAALARDNAEANTMTSCFTVIEGDVSARPAPVPAESIDHVMANPPFIPSGRGSLPTDLSKAVATIEGAEGLCSWLDFCVMTVRPGGTVTFIHRADRLGDLLAAIGASLGGIIVCPVWSAAGKQASRIIVSGIKGIRTPLSLHSGLVLHEADGTYTVAAQAILRDGGALNLDIS